MSDAPTVERRRLLVVTNNLGGGTGTHLVSLLRRWDPARWDVHLLCQALVEVEPPPHVGLTRDLSRGPLDRFPVAQLRRILQLRRTIRQERPDLVHAYFFWPIVYARLLKQVGRIRRLVENREDEGFNLGEREYRILRRTSHLPDRVICVSGAVADVVREREGVEPERIRVIPNGVGLPEERGEDPDGRVARSELGFGPEDRIVGMVANLNRGVKGVDYFVAAMPRIRERVPGARFLVLGDGPDRAALEGRARELGVGDHVVFAGFRSDIGRFYPIMDVSVLTSLSEGLSITVLESMSHALPMVATRVGGNPEVIRDGETGYLVPPRDVSAFSDRVVELLERPERAREMGAAGRRVIEREFQLDRVAERYEGVYREVLGSRAGRGPRARETTEVEGS